MFLEAEALSVLGVRGKKAEFVFQVKAIKKGFTFSSYQRLRKDLSLTDQDLALALGIRVAEVNRIKRLSARFKLVPSDRLYRIARIFALAIELFRDKKAAADWLRCPQFGLGGRIPFDVLQTEPGAKEVENLLGRLAHGVIS